MDPLTVSQVYVSMFSTYLEQLQTKRPEFQLKRISLPTVTHQKNGSVTLASMEEFISSIVKTTKNHSLGLEIGAHIHPSDYGIFGCALMNCSTLAQAMGMVERNITLLNQAFTFTSTETKNNIHFELKNSTTREIGNVLVELQFASDSQMAKFLTGPQQNTKVGLTEVHFKHRPLTTMSRYVEVFNCPVLFNQKKNEMIVSKTMLSQRIRSASPKILSMLLKKINRIQDEMNNNVSLGQRVYEFVEGSISNQGVPSAELVARNFNISLSTLKKHLHLESLNFTTICDEVRRKIAINRVVHSSEQLQNISEGLGFSNTSAFNRAFRRWTNVTPAEYRRNNMHRPIQKLAVGDTLPETTSDLS
jgi:AraC-like DNA-binding protein